VIVDKNQSIVGNVMKVDAHDLRTNETDDRGQLYPGTEYARTD